MRSETRVAVIGGGVIGCSVLYHLARAGWTDVTLIERSELTSGSSWHAAGGFHTLNADPNVARLQAYTVGLYRELEALSGQSCGLHLTLVIDADDADVMGDEPIWARTDSDWVTPPHGAGADRFDAAGVAVPRPDGRRDGAWRVAGWVTSGGFGHRVGLSLAQGYLPAALASEAGSGMFEVEILGRRRSAGIAPEPLWDPGGLRMRN